MRILWLMAAALAFFGATPASAQFFLKPVDLRGAPVTGVEPEMIAQPLPGATVEELRAALVWNLRAALNVSALQCNFERMLLTEQTYNGVLRSHDAELKATYEALDGYFIRNAPDKREGQREFDRFSTRVYSGFSTVSAQLIFCRTAATIGRQALFTPRGQLYTLAEQRLRELRNSLVPWGEQQFGTKVPVQKPVAVPAAFRNPRCWDKEDYWIVKRCGEPFVGGIDPKAKR